MTTGPKLFSGLIVGAFLIAGSTSAATVQGDAKSPEQTGVSPEAWLSIMSQIEAAEAAEPVPASLTTTAIPKVMSSSRVEEDLQRSIAVDGGTVVVGARGAFKDASDDQVGAAYVFERQPSAVDPWRLVTKLVGSGAEAGSGFGIGVGIFGDTIIVGASAGGTGSGAAYVFYRDEGGAGNWGEVAEVLPAAGDGGAFGQVVDIEGDLAIVGSPYDNLGGTANQAGAAFLLGRNEGGADNWGIITKLTASDAAAADRLGWAVGVSGDIAAVGSWWETSGDGAVYLFERDYPTAGAWGQRKKLSGPSGEAAHFGRDLSIEGDELLVGAPYADPAAGDNLGAAFLHGRNEGAANSWGEIHQFVSGETDAWDGFGFSVALDGNTAAVSSWRDDDDGTDFGAVFVFNRDEGGAGAWGESAEIAGSESAALTRYGTELALSSNTLLVTGGGQNADRYSGIVYLHERNTDGPEAWGEASILLDDSGSQFGWSVAIDSETMVVGAWGARDACLDALWCLSGAAYVFERVPEDGPRPEAWRFSKRIVASDGMAGHNFGWSVDLSGDTIVVGARGASPNGGGSGAAYIFDRDYDPGDPGTPVPENWGERVILPGAAGGDGFGGSVAIGDDTVVIGANAAASYDGRAYVFGRNAGGANMWGLVRTLSPPLSTGSDLFGSAVAISGDSVVVGSPQYNHMAINNTGAVFAFDRDLGGTGNWGHAGTLVATDFREYGELGWSVGIFADTVVAGSFSEVLPADTDNGAAYVFERDQGGVGNWGQTRKLVASDAAANDEFGSDVDISWDTIVVGAMENDDACPADPTCESGAAYVFERDRNGPGLWGESAKLTAFDASGLQRLGRSVAVDRLTVGVGAPFDLDLCLGTGVCRAGGVYTYKVSSDLAALDFGDSPYSYYTTLDLNGARHYPWGPRLGTLLDTEPDGQPTADANGDDLTGVDDEDGVTFLDPLTPGTTARVKVDVTAPALLGAWVDFNANGNFFDDQDRLTPFTGTVLAVGSNILDVSVPATAVAGTETYARFRIASLEVAQNPANPWYPRPYEPGDPLPDGEVEDYAVTLGGSPATADCAITKSNYQVGVTIGSSITYTIVVSNAGPDDVTGATVADTLPAEIDSCAWTCVASGGASCTASPAAGNLSDAANLPAGDSVTYTGECAVSGTASGTLTNTATLTAPAGVTDPNSANDSATDSDALSTEPPVSIEMFGEETGTRMVEAQETITVTNLVVKAGAVLTLRAGSEVILGDGVVVEDGAELVIEIDPTLLP